jgi:pyrophosphatase PpaX
LTRFTAVLFDLDGTLIDSKPLIRESFLHSWKHVVGTEPPVDRFMPMVGLPFKMMMQAMIKTLPADLSQRHEDDAEKLMQSYRAYMFQHEESLHPFPGVIPVLKELSSRGLKLGLVTSKQGPTATRHLKVTGIHELLDEFVFEEDSLEKKPLPGPFLTGARRFGVPAEVCLAVGDAPADLASGHGAGMLFGAALWGADPREALIAAGPDFMLESPEDVLKVI